MVIDAPMSVVRKASEGLRDARVVLGPGGKVWVQSPDLEALGPDEMKMAMLALQSEGVEVVVLESQEPLPEGR